MDKRKKLLYITPVLPPTRAPEADHALYQALHFAKRGIEVHVLTRGGQGLDPHPEITIHQDIRSWSWLELPKVARLLRRVRPDAVMMSFLGTLYAYRTMPTLIPLLTKLVARSAVFAVQFANLGQGVGIRNSVLRQIFLHAGAFRYGSLLFSPDVLIALSESHRARLVELRASNAPKIFVVPVCPQMPIANDRLEARRLGRQRLGVPEEATLVTFFGRLYPGKGIEQVIEATALLRPSHPGLRLGLVGGFLEPEIFHNARPSYEQELRGRVAAARLDGLVAFSGEYPWDGPEASQYLYACDLAVLPLGPGIHLYNSSLAAVCAHGLPVIGTRGAITDSALKPRENVYFIEDAAPSTIASAIAEVLADRDLRTKLASGSRDLAAEYFDWDRSISRLIALMKLDSG